MTTKKQQAEIDESIERLRTSYDVGPGTTIYTTTLHTSRSGMTREIKAMTTVGGVPVDISGHVARIIGVRYGNRGGVMMGGAGMDMGFALVYSLSRRLFPNGFECSGQPSCPANDHANDYGESIRRAKHDILGDPWATDLTQRQRNEVDIAAARLRETDLTYRKGRHHDDGGYALNHRWL